jgi:hypothetical protein
VHPVAANDVAIGLVQPASDVMVQCASLFLEQPDKPAQGVTMPAAAHVFMMSPSKVDAVGTL